MLNLPYPNIKNDLHCFISHRDKHKANASELANNLNSIGFSCFVAHDHIEPMSMWKHVILDNLEKMDCFIAFLTDDFYDSNWTNQEIGYALARKVPIFWYSHNKLTIPKGFQEDIQSFKRGVPELIDSLIEKFNDHAALKHAIINELCKAQEGNFNHAKNVFMQLSKFKFNDEEIDQIIYLIVNEQKIKNNQLRVILDDPIPKDYKDYFGTKYEFCYQILENEILNSYSYKRYVILEVEGRGNFIKDLENELNVTTVNQRM